ncbi:complement factor H-like [Uloborus diversus]|uniref:complement factor H-like n=1 Tax=Uloborus diversus TaxID=327109 RepID=UPI0024097F2C|nr:complement factor H-like [Uloborus diversus]
MGKYVTEKWRLHFKKSRIGSRVIENEEQILRCDPGYFIAGKTTEENNVSCLDGKWSEDFTCVSSGCATDPPPTKNGNTHTKRDFHGGTVTYICNTLFSKDNFTNCKDVYL